MDHVNMRRTQQILQPTFRHLDAPNDPLAGPLHTHSVDLEVKLRVVEAIPM